MTGSVNRAILLGRLGADPETRRLQSGDAVVSFRLATTETWRDGQSGAKRYATQIVRQRFRGEIQLLGDGGKSEAASADRGADRRPSEPKGASSRQASGRGNYGEASGRSATKPKSAERDYSFDDEIPF